ncbi:MAG: putative RNA 2'-phosphotransferase [Promethearchaeota archaeon]|nr:MAG: putative RNA 2'-phosphotransferase [Candidatus Lokiarchaeota archaeon]
MHTTHRKKLYIRVSKFLSYLLRHNPEKYGIQLDSYGYADLEKVLSILNKKFSGIQIDKIFLIDLIRASEKVRFELNQEKIRAYYGHSLTKTIKMPKIETPPQKLFHGTTKFNSEKILREGLKSKGRQYVHLTDNIHTAEQVARRRTDNSVILEIDTRQAIIDGINFYKSGDMYLADFIPTKYIKIL